MAKPKVGQRAVVDGLGYTITEADDKRVVCKDEARLAFEASDAPVDSDYDAGKRVSIPLRALYYHEGFGVWCIPGRENPRKVKEAVE